MMTVIDNVFECPIKPSIQDGFVILDIIGPIPQRIGMKPHVAAEFCHILNATVQSAETPANGTKTVHVECDDSIPDKSLPRSDMFSQPKGPSF